VGKYRILIKPSAVREIESIPRKDRLRIVRKIQALSQNPRPPGCDKLSAEEKYRVRQGWYRIAYSEDDQNQTVLVVKMGHRREVYR
jgi:mRNA interferase RelE/StbE